MTFDQGDLVPLGISITDTTGAPANSGAVTVTIYLPDGTTATPSVLNSSTGSYIADYQPALVGTYRVKWIATGLNPGAQNDEFNVRDPFGLGPFSLQEAKDHLNISSSATDGEILRFMDTATDLVEKYLGQIVGRRTFTDNLTGGTLAVMLTKNPILSVSSVVENGVTLASSVYRIDNNSMMLVRTDSQNWSYIFESITVIYVAGYQLVPPGIVHGIKELLRHFWETQRQATQVQSANNKQDDGYDPRTGYSLPRRVREILDLNRDVIVG